MLKQGDYKNGTITIPIIAADEKHSNNASNIKDAGPPAKTDFKIIEVAEKQNIPWFAGCEYQCRYNDCGTMFFYNQDLRSHIKKEHEDPDFYLVSRISTRRSNHKLIFLWFDEELLQN